MTKMGLMMDLIKSDQSRYLGHIHPPWVRSRVWDAPGLELGLALREGWMDTPPPETWIAPLVQVS